MAETLTPQALERMFESVKNWGRWGPQDERGALNFITPAKRAPRRRWCWTAKR
jgi:hypothetical protein